MSPFRGAPIAPDCLCLETLLHVLLEEALKVGLQINENKIRVRKILNVRYFEDETGKRWSRCVKDKKFEILCVSQFTLCHKLKGNKLDFHCAMAPTESEAFYNKLLEYLKKSYEPDLIKDGKFGEYMQVDIVNDGPVTIHLESPSSQDSDSSQALDASYKPTENSDGN
ncbi:D-aminoacyl-tRNA deacylase 1 isoform X2 [Ischnura elegans]|uniref:D-aminoacyl-tRNA deacylase 1 isoform X2 n=1 Tax=Ischnura elegans TaxID=197161 RepID=UPI001ED8B2EE|nr:D-aminoacyl-tRNA deacylase 1 isoform X2 [Ischnura elegans]